MKDEERVQRRDTFLGDAEDYLVARPGYPDALVDAAMEWGGLTHGDGLLEVGCGTGEATEAFAQRGLAILALERSEPMARLARRRLASFPGVEIRIADLEESDPGERFPGLLIATAYHWLDPTTRARRCAERLLEGGVLILLWHTHPPPYTGYHDRSQAIYRSIVPDWEPPATPGMSEARVDGIVRELEKSGWYESVARRTHDWSHTYDRDTYLRLLSTYSDHRLLGEDQRSLLFSKLAALIDADFGGEVERPYRTELVLARRGTGQAPPPGTTPAPRRDGV